MGTKFIEEYTNNILVDSLEYEKMKKFILDELLKDLLLNLGEEIKNNDNLNFTIMANISNEYKNFNDRTKIILKLLLFETTFEHNKDELKNIIEINMNNGFKLFRDVWREIKWKY